MTTTERILNNMENITGLTRVFNYYRNNKIYIEVPTPSFDLTITFSPCSVKEARNIAIEDFYELTYYIEHTKKKYKLDFIKVTYLAENTDKEIFTDKK